MRVGLSMTNFSWPGSPASLRPNVSTIARKADEAGIDSFWAMDHFYQIPFNGPEDAEMPELYSVLSFVAGQTERMKLGSLVTGVAYRYPAILVKTVTTLDVLSGGRVILGLGASWSDNEAQGYGIAFPPLSVRFELLEELLQIAKHMWSGNTGPFTGPHHQLARPLNVPNTLQRPQPPILIGGGGERKTLRLVARYADACNLFDLPGQLDMVRQKLAVLREHCEAEGRPYTDIEKTTFGRLDLTPQGGDGTMSLKQAVEHFEELAEVGIDHVIVEPGAPWDPASLDLLASIVPDLHQITPAGR